MHDPYLSYPYVWLHVCTPAIGFPPLVVNLWTPSWHFGPALSWQVWGFLQEGFGSALAAPAVSLSRNGALCLQPFAGRVWCCIYCRHPAWEGVELLADAALICFYTFYNADSIRRSVGIRPGRCAQTKELRACSKTWKSRRCWQRSLTRALKRRIFWRTWGFWLFALAARVAFIV